MVFECRTWLLLGCVEPVSLGFLCGEGTEVSSVSHALFLNQSMVSGHRRDNCVYEVVTTEFPLL